MSGRSPCHPAPGRPLTDISQTAWTTPDPRALYGRRVDPDLRKRTGAYLPDVLYVTTDQKVGGSSPSERARYPQVRGQ